MLNTGSMFCFFFLPFLTLTHVVTSGHKKGCQGLQVLRTRCKYIRKCVLHFIYYIIYEVYISAIAVLYWGLIFFVLFDCLYVFVPSSSFCACCLHASCARHLKNKERAHMESDHICVEPWKLISLFSVFQWWFHR
jgi:hypothetical protein